MKSRDQHTVDDTRANSILWQTDYLVYSLGRSIAEIQYLSELVR
jgi:hypothetical protein